MKRILLSLLIIASLSILTVGMTGALFMDAETSLDNTFLTGTIDIDIDGENPWQGGLEIGDIKPAEEKNFEWRINNVGTYPANIWLTFENLTNLTGEQSEPECEAEDGVWDEANKLCGGMSNENNSLDEVLDYGLRVEVYAGDPAGKIFSQIIYARDYVPEKHTLGEVAGRDIILGMIPVGGYMEVYQEFGFQSGAGNEYQGDIVMFDTKIAAEQLRGRLVLENKDKDSGYVIRHDDDFQAILHFTPKAPMFSYNLIGKVPAAERDYSLIYYADPWNQYRGLVIGEAESDLDGNIIMQGSADIDSLPLADDAIYPYGAKIQLVPTNAYSISGGRLKITGWGQWDNFLTETSLVFYEKTNYGPVVIPDAPSGLPEAPASEGNSGPSAPTVKTLDFEDLGAVTQYGYWHDYGSADVSFAYSDPLAGENLQGTVTASGLKPYATYQLKFEGKPACLYGAGGNDAANEYIGYKGRWTCVSGPTCTGSASARNRSDSEYLSKSCSKNPHDPNCECMVGYLVWGHVTADGSGSALKEVEAADSYHVLWCSGGICGLKNNDELKQPDPANPGIYFCAAEDVNGELEHPAASPCGGLDMDIGVYDLKFILNEESFHKSPGTWTAVMDADIQFELK